jgi:hypothetical protein
VRNYTLGHFVEDYKDGLEEFLQHYSATECASMIQADMDPAAMNEDIAALSTKDSMVVLGHTHIPDMQLVKRTDYALSPTPDVLVVNAGAWVVDVQGNPHSSYLDITLDDVLDAYPDCYTQANGTDYRGTVHKTVMVKPASRGDPTQS